MILYIMFIDFFCIHELNQSNEFKSIHEFLLNIQNTHNILFYTILYHDQNKIVINALFIINIPWFSLYQNGAVKI